MDKTNKTLLAISAVIVVIIICLIVLFLNKKTSTYSILFDSQGGSTVLDQSVEKNSKALKPADPKKEGHIFIEWQYNNKPFDFNSKINKDMTLVATWQKVEENAEMITIEFDTDGGSIVSRQIIKKDTKVKEPEETKKEGYIFIEWTLDDKKFDFDTEVKENITLKAKWEKEPEKNVEKNDTEEKQSNSEEPPKSTSNDKPDKKQYTITFDTNGGSSIPSQIVEENEKAIQPENPTKTGYTFDSWILNNNMFSFDSLINNNLKLRAAWKANKYTISYNINTDTGSGSIESTTCEYDKECNLNSNNFTNENCTFSGWSTNSNGEATYSNSSTVKNLTSYNNATITLYAIWECNE